MGELERRDSSASGQAAVTQFPATLSLPQACPLRGCGGSIRYDERQQMEAVRDLAGHRAGTRRTDHREPYQQLQAGREVRRRPRCRRTLRPPGAADVLDRRCTVPQNAETQVPNQRRRSKGHCGAEDGGPPIPWFSLFNVPGCRGRTAGTPAAPAEVVAGRYMRVKAYIDPFAVAVLGALSFRLFWSRAEGP